MSAGDLGMGLAVNQILAEHEADKLLMMLERAVGTASSAERSGAILDQLVVAALLLSGLRNSEFCSLAVRDTIIGTQQSAFLIRRPAARRRTVHVPWKLSNLVVQYVKDVRPHFLPKGVDAGDGTQPLILNEHRRPYERTGLYRRVVRILTEAGLGDRASVQLLRHTYGYLAYLRTGGNLLFVQRQLGHAHPGITSAYARLVDESYSDLAERVGGGGGWTAVGAAKAYAGYRPKFDPSED